MKRSEKQVKWLNNNVWNQPSNPSQNLSFCNLKLNEYAVFINSLFPSAKKNWKDKQHFTFKALDENGKKREFIGLFTSNHQCFLDDKNKKLTDNHVIFWESELDGERYLRFVKWNERDDIKKQHSIKCCENQVFIEVDGKRTESKKLKFNENYKEFLKANLEKQMRKVLVGAKTSTRLKGNKYKLGKGVKVLSEFMTANLYKKDVKTIRGCHNIAKTYGYAKCYSVFRRELMKGEILIKDGWRSVIFRIIEEKKEPVEEVSGGGDEILRGDYCYKFAKQFPQGNILYNNIRVNEKTMDYHAPPWNFNEDWISDTEVCVNFKEKKNDLLSNILN